MYLDKFGFNGFYRSGFVMPKDESAFKTMSDGWKAVVDRVGAISGGRN